MGAEIGLRHPRAKGTLFTGDHRTLEEVGRGSPPEHQRGSGSADTLISSDFRPPGRWDVVLSRLVCGTLSLQPSKLARPPTPQRGGRSLRTAKGWNQTTGRLRCRYTVHKHRLFPRRVWDPCPQHPDLRMGWFLCTWVHTCCKSLHRYNSTYTDLEPWWAGISYLCLMETRFYIPNKWQTDSIFNKHLCS